MPPPHKKRKGWSSKYFTRTQSLKKLQLPLKSFRQLCIYKGIHPRVPKKTRGDVRVFYHNKDIKFMAHEPSIAVIRKQRQFYRKIRAAKQRKDKAEMKRLELKFPKLSLSHILKERYPTFQHALRDLDDPLTMAHLYGNLHQQGNHRESPQVHEAASRLCAEFQAYVVKTHSLRKVFVSVKGYYYQVVKNNSSIHSSHCVVDLGGYHGDGGNMIDPFIMLCHMEFYKTMLGFVNFRLFHSIGMRYPPRLTETERNTSVALEALLRKDDESAVTEVVAMEASIDKTDTAGEQDEDELVEIENDDENEIGEKAVGATGSVPATDDAALCSKLFNGLVFFLGRETPVDQLIFVIQSFGGIVAWDGDGSTFDVSDPRITHCICDREKVKEGMKAPGREYVQPQWIFDSCNARVLLPTELYAIGKTAPPHLSPFVSYEEEGYVPDYAKQIRKVQEAANLVRRTNDTSAQERAIAEMLNDDIEFQEEGELEKANKEEEEYIGELELELETEFPTDISSDRMNEELKKAKQKRRQEESVKETHKMEEIMVTKKHQYKKLKRKEYAKKAKVERLQRKKANLDLSESSQTETKP